MSYQQGYPASRGGSAAATPYGYGHPQPQPYVYSAGSGSRARSMNYYEEEMYPQQQTASTRRSPPRGGSYVPGDRQSSIVPASRSREAGYTVRDSPARAPKPLPGGETTTPTKPRGPANYVPPSHRPVLFTYEPPDSGRGALKAFHGQNRWETPLFNACFYHPRICFLSTIAPFCCVYAQRKKLLFGEKKNYVCCAGLWGQGCTSNFEKCTRGNEDLCLCMETAFCLGCAIHANRWMILSHYNLQRDCCDVVLDWLSCPFGVLACLVGDENVENLADFLYTPFIPCMISQHEHQMEEQGYPVGQQRMY